MKQASRGAKSLIFYSRDYRRFKSSFPLTILFFLTPVLPVALCFLFFYEPLTFQLSGWAASILTSVTNVPATVSSDPYIPWFGDIHYVDMPGKTPTFTFSLINALVCLILFVVATRISTNFRPFMIYICMGLGVHFISSVFFMIVPELFPYTLTDYSILYMKQQISIWMLIALLSGLAMGMMVDGGIGKLVAFFVTMLYSFIFGCLRYVVFLFILHVASSIYMAALFFMFGVLFDFMQLVAIYAIYVNYVSNRMDTFKGRERWQWS